MIDRLWRSSTAATAYPFHIALEDSSHSCIGEMSGWYLFLLLSFEGVKGLLDAMLKLTNVLSD